MTRFEAPTRTRRRGLAATALALVVALLAVGSPLAASADVVGTGPGTVSGTVTQTGGEPLAGAQVIISNSIGEGTIFNAYTLSDAAGHYEFTGLEVGNYSLSSHNTNFQNVPGQQVSISEATPAATADFEFAPFVVGLGTISGLVTGDGAPLAGQFISVQNYATGQSQFTVSDENGLYEFSGLSNGTWNFASPWAPGYQYLYPAPVELTDAAPSATRDFPFVSYPTGTSSITGALTDAATGAPIQGVNVSLYGVDVAQSANAGTDETGSYSFPSLPAGTYVLNFFAFDYLGPSAEVTVAEGETVTFDRALVATNASISGRVTGPNGVPVVGEYVEAHTEAGAFAGAVTDENGDYLIIGVGAVGYTLSVGGPGTPFDRVQRPVTPVANETIVENFTLQARTTGSFGGWVLDVNGEYYNEPVCVTLFGSKNKKPLAEVVTIGEDFGDGSWSFNDLKPGSYTAEFRDCDDDPKTKFDKVFLGGVKKHKDATYVTVVAGVDSFENTVTLTPRGH